MIHMWNKWLLVLVILVWCILVYLLLMFCCSSKKKKFLWQLSPRTRDIAETAIKLNKTPYAVFFTGTMKWKFFCHSLSLFSLFSCANFLWVCLCLFWQQQTGFFLHFQLFSVQSKASSMPCFDTHTQTAELKY